MPTTNISIDGLRGSLILPDDPRYDDARALRYGGMDRRPAAIARVADAKDATRVIDHARSTDMPLAVKSGAHSVKGDSVIEGSLMLDLSDMHALDIDASSRTAWVESGMTAGAFTEAAHEHELAVGFGDAATVGIGGITTGGGVGFLGRRYGLTIDSLLEAEVVTADARILRASEDEHPDLFWAIRGGGGNFGVLTRLRFALHPVGRVVGGMLLLPATAETVEGFVEASRQAPEELSAIANVLPAPPMPFIDQALVGSLVIIGLIVYAGEIEAGERAMRPFRALARPLADMLQPMPYPSIYMPEEGPPPVATSRTGFMDGFDHTHAEAIVDAIGEAAGSLPPGSMRATQLRVLGGAIGQVANDATAYSHREREIMVNVAALLAPEEEIASADAWVQGLSRRLRGDDLAGYVNFLGDEGPVRTRAAYPGATWERLRSVKAAYDPSNLFRHNQNIPPA